MEPQPVPTPAAQWGVGGWAEPYCRSLKAQCPPRGVQRRPANRCASGWQPLARPAAPEQHCPAETLHEPQTRAMGMILTLLGATFKKIKKENFKKQEKVILRINFIH